jgi:5-methylcytosine-specific restriction endonuclease McrA
MLKTLLLNSGYEVLSFINERKAFKLLFKDKVEVIASWNNKVKWINGYIDHPSVLILKDNVRRNFIRYTFSRSALIKRDNSTCQYCGKKLLPSQITVDHIIPKSQGGPTSFINCVVSCFPCNSKKANLPPDKVGMKLLSKPTNPSISIQYNSGAEGNLWNDEWDKFLQPN